MSSYVFDQVKEMVASGVLQFQANSGLTYKLALLNDTIVNNPETYSSYKTWSQIQALVPKVEVSTDGTGYSQQTLQNVGLVSVNDSGGSCDDKLPDYIAFAKNIGFNVSTITASCIVIVLSTPTGGINDTDSLLMAIDIRKLIGDSYVPVMSNNGVFNIQLDQASGGFLKFK